MTWAINFANAWFRVDKRHTCDHLVDVSIRTMKDLNGPIKVNGSTYVFMNAFKELEWFSLYFEM